MTLSTTPVAVKWSTTLPAPCTVGATSSQAVPIAARRRRAATLGRELERDAAMIWRTSPVILPPPSAHRLAACLEVTEHQGAPRLEAILDDRDGGRLGEGPFELVGLADRHRPAARLGDVDRTDVDTADLGRVVVEEADELEFRLEACLDLLGPLAPQPADEVAVARVEVATDPDRPAVVQPDVAAGARPPHQEVARPVAEDQVRDHLLPAAVRLHLGARSELAIPGHDPLEAVEANARHAVPSGISHQRRPRDDEDLLDRHRALLLIGRISWRGFLCCSWRGF